MGTPEDKEIKAILAKVVRESIHRSLVALEKAGALNLEKLRKGYDSEQGKYYRLVDSEIQYTVSFAPNDVNIIGNTIVWVMSDAFNRAVGVLSKSRAINTKKLRQEYRGVGSKYYDIVTVEMQSCIPEWVNLIGQYKNVGDLVFLKNETKI